MRHNTLLSFASGSESSQKDSTKKRRVSLRRKNQPNIVGENESSAKKARSSSSIKKTFQTNINQWRTRKDSNSNVIDPSGTTLSFEENSTSNTPKLADTTEQQNDTKSLLLDISRKTIQTTILTQLRHHLREYARMELKNRDLGLTMIHMEGNKVESTRWLEETVEWSRQTKFGAVIWASKYSTNVEFTNQHCKTEHLKFLENKPYCHLIGPVSRPFVPCKLVRYKPSCLETSRKSSLSKTTSMKIRLRTFQSVLFMRRRQSP